MSPPRPGDHVRLKSVGVVIRFHDTGMAIVKWDNGLTGMAKSEQLIPAHDPDHEALIEYIQKACEEAAKRGRVTGEPLHEWISRLPLDVESR